MRRNTAPGSALPTYNLGASCKAAACVLRRGFYAYRVRRARRRAATHVQRAVRARQAAGGFAGRRHLIHACHG